MGVCGESHVEMTLLTTHKLTTLVCEQNDNGLSSSSKELNFSNYLPT